ncbi:hypothetical protein D9M68_557300 [compost metagenome]
MTAVQLDLFVLTTDWYVGPVVEPNGSFEGACRWNIGNGSSLRKEYGAGAQ